MFRCPFLNNFDNLLAHFCVIPTVISYENIDSFLKAGLCTTFCFLFVPHRYRPTTLLQLPQFFWFIVKIDLKTFYANNTFFFNIKNCTTCLTSGNNVCRKI